MAFHPGDRVTILPPYAGDPVIIEQQHYATVARRTDAGYMLDLGHGTMPPNQEFGPFPEKRLVGGWGPR